MHRTVPILTLILCGLPAGADTDGPSFDCSRAASDAEDRVCESPDLAALDRELARLFGLAIDGPNIGARENELRAMQRGWIKGRDDCWKAEDLTDCVRFSYGSRILEIRQDFADARGDDAAGISVGPFAYVCEGLDAGIAAVFIGSDPALAVLQWRDTIVVLSSTPTASGAKYDGESWDGPTTFWTKGETATLSLPDGRRYACTEDDIG